MVEAHVHNLSADQLNVLRDPSRTMSLRDAFVRAMQRRFRALRRLIWRAIVEEDVFGLETAGKARVTVMQTPGRRRFAFPRSSDKVAAFMEWLQKAIEDEILQVTQITQVGRAVEAAWTNLYIQDSYKRGVIRGRYQLRDAPPLSSTGGIDQALSNPFHIDRLGLLYTRAFNELKGITDAMAQQISRVLAQGVADGESPRVIARRLNQVISGQGDSLAIQDTLGRFIPAERRAEILARTEIIRAHAEAQLQEYKNWRVAGVMVKAEIVTAGDERVCPICESYTREVMSIEEASGLIPFHARCRCIWTPYYGTKRGE